MKRLITDQCSLCSERPAIFTGVFQPNQEFAKRIGQPKGKVRLVLYRVCDHCNELPDKLALIEAAILANMQIC